MPKNPEKQEKIKETGWEEKFKERHEMLKEVAEGKKLEKQKAETIDKEGVDLEETELTEEREKLPEAYGETPKDREKELERLLKETGDELTKKLEQEKKLSGKELSETEIYHLTRDFYREKLGYEIEHKGFLGGKLRLKDKEGKYVLEGKTGKSVEFKKVPRSETETSLINFLKEKYKNNVKEDIEKRFSEKGKEDYKKWKEHFGPLAEAWKEQEEFEREIGKESDKLMQEKRNELVEKIEQERKKAGRKLSDTEIYTLTRNFYLGELGYEIKYRGLLGGKARIWNKEKGGYVIDEKTGKPLEFEAKFSPKGETPFRRFLEEEYKNKIIKRDLRAKYQEKAGEVQPIKVEEPEAIEKEKEYQEWQKTVGVIEAQKLAQTFEAHKTKEARTTEVGAKEKQIGESETVKVATQEEEIKPVEKKEAERKETEIPPATIKKLIEFFEGFNIEPDERKRTGMDRQIQRVLDGLKVGKVDLAEREISRMLEKSEMNLETAKERKNLRLAKQHENNIEKLEGFLREIKSPAETEKKEMTVEELAEVIESAVNKGNAKKEGKGESGEK